eukprot:m.24794 g.24794  ORF g.24794 m.24794 type:complete len:61 (-) comp8638_c0_seq1:86-268(-)
MQSNACLYAFSTVFGCPRGSMPSCPIVSVWILTAYSLSTFPLLPSSSLALLLIFLLIFFI